MSTNNQRGSRVNVKAESPGPALIRSLTGLRDTLKKDQPLAERFTLRTVELDLELREFTATEVVKVREQLRASQGIFAKLLGVSIKTVQAWEQGNNPPSPTARRLLETIEANPEPWAQRLRAAAAVS